MPPATSKILDQFGQPIRLGDLTEPQTARLASVTHGTLESALDGLSPSRLAAALRAADDGDLLAQHRLFSDMEGRDAHLAAEMGKRKNALVGLPWDIVPPRNATPAEETAAEWVKEVLQDALDPIEDLVLFLMEAIGHGFACAELEWKLQDGEWLPSYHPRPQEWFRLDWQTRSELRLIDNSSDGQPLQPFGWVWHVPGKAKTGYMGRMGLYRAAVWPFLYKAYAISDFAEFLETYGLPIITGKYFNGATPDEKSSLMRAVTALGHDARAIMPQEMTLEISKITGSGDDLHLRQVDWADKSMSKLILGGTLTSQADGKTSTNALGSVHNEVRHDILVSDARQMASTLTRDLIYPLLALNKVGIDSLRRCPRLVFDTGKTEDIAVFAEALPKLVGAGMKSIPVAWVHEKLRIPQAEGGEPVLGVSQVTPPAQPKEAAKPTAPVAALSAHTAQDAPMVDAQQTLDAALETPIDWAAIADPLLVPVLNALSGGMTSEDILAEMADWYPLMDDAAMVETLSRALFVADTWGRLSAQGE